MNLDNDKDLKIENEKLKKDKERLIEMNKNIRKCLLHIMRELTK